MTKNETKTLLSKIKGYYNSQFFIDEYVIDAWYETMKPYDLEDAIEHIQVYVKENSDVAPKPQTFKRGLLTHEEKMRYRNSKYVVNCNLCKRLMSFQEYEDHYGRCLGIQYLLGITKNKNLDLTREQLESYSPHILNKLIEKYKPKEVEHDFVSE